MCVLDLVKRSACKFRVILDASRFGTNWLHLHTYAHAQYAYTNGFQVFL